MTKKKIAKLEKMATKFMHISTAVYVLISVTFWVFCLVSCSVQKAIETAVTKATSKYEVGKVYTNAPLEYINDPWNRFLIEVKPLRISGEFIEYEETDILNGSHNTKTNSQEMFMFEIEHHLNKGVWEFHTNSFAFTHGIKEIKVGLMFSDVYTNTDDPFKGPVISTQIMEVMEIKSNFVRLHELNEPILKDDNFTYPIDQTFVLYYRSLNYVKPK